MGLPEKSQEVEYIFYMEGKYSMRKKMTSKVMSIALTAAMALSLAACSSGNDTSNTPAPADTTGSSDTATETAPADTTTEPVADATEPVEEVEPYTVYTDADGNPIDLGGMEIVVRDWWTDPEGDSYFRNNPQNEYEEARAEYVDWVEEKYNFKLVQKAISDWGSTPADFVDDVTSGGDGTNYVWIVRDSQEIAQAMATGLMYDLSKLDCLDFSEEFFTANKVHEQYTYKGGIYAMYGGLSEPRGGFYINKQILADANVDINDIYDAQKNGTWTWDMFLDILSQVQKDTDNDGTNDIWGVTGNTGGWGQMFAVSNGGEWVGNSADGYTYRLEDPETIEGMDFALKLLNEYYMPRPEGANWDYYKEEFLNGTVAFCEDGGMYAGRSDGELASAQFPVGYVMIPAGPSGSLVNIASNNPVVLPSYYDDETAWKVAFAWYVWNQAPAGYEDYNPFVGQARTGIFDERACDETIPMMSEPEHVVITYSGMIPGISGAADMGWFPYPGGDTSAAIEMCAESWKTFIDTANGK